MSEKEIMPIVDPHIGDTAIRDAEKRQQRDADLLVYQAREEYYRKLLAEVVVHTRREVMHDEAEYLYNWLGDGVALDSVDAAELKRHLAYLWGKDGGK